MDASRVGELRAFVEACKKDPALLADPSLAFFQDYLTSLGVDLPAGAKAGPEVYDEDGLDMRDPTLDLEPDEDIVESDLELEGDFVQPDHGEATQKMGDPSVEVTEESRDASQQAKGMAMDAMSEGKLEEAAEHLTKAVLLNPTSSIMYASRASVFIKMKKPVAAICDANAALEINPDCAKGYKTRGMANMMLGKWEEAARDLHTASNIDYDDEISAVLKKVEPNAHKIVEHRRKYDRLRKEREEKKAERDRLRCAEAQVAYEKSKRNDHLSSCSSGGASSMGFPGGMPGGFPGEMGGGMPEGMGRGFRGGGLPVGMPSGFLGTAKKLLCSTAPAEQVSNKVLDNDCTSSSPVPVSPLDDDDLLVEIILRLPLQPSSLPRASIVCNRWLRILSGEKFIECYRKHHHRPSLLGFFAGFTENDLNFVPVLDTEPNCILIPPERFAVPKSSRPYHFWSFLGCRHGLAVLLNERLREVVVWDPLTGQRHHVSFPQELRAEEFDEDEEFMLWQWHTAVMCSDSEEGHVHGDCFSSPFKLVLICSGEWQTFACLYESASGVWGDVVSVVTRGLVLLTRSSILTGNAFYWLSEGGNVLVFDIEHQTIGVIKKPVDAHRVNHWSFQLLRTDNGTGLGLAVMLKSSIQLWERRLNSDGVADWVLLQKTFQLEMLFPQGMRSELIEAFQVGYDEDSNEIVLVTRIGNFMLELDSMRFRTISKSQNPLDIKIHHPYRNFVTAGRGVGWKRVVLDL